MRNLSPPHYGGCVKMRPAIALPLQNDCASILASPIMSARSAGGGGLDAIMLIHVLTSNIHRMRITAGNVDCADGLGIARDPMDRAAQWPGE